MNCRGALAANVNICDRAGIWNCVLSTTPNAIKITKLSTTRQPRLAQIYCYAVVLRLNIIRLIEVFTVKYRSFFASVLYVWSSIIRSPSFVSPMIVAPQKPVNDFVVKNLPFNIL
jgi:chloramphenicol O-acetyltransferase